MARPLNLDSPLNRNIFSPSGHFATLCARMISFLPRASRPFKTFFGSLQVLVASLSRCILFSRASSLRASKKPGHAIQLSAALVPALFAWNAIAVEFETKNIRIGEKIIAVEIADTDPRRSLGLMNRQSLEKDHGMLFVFADENYRRFWMKETYIPLDIAFFSRERILLEVHTAVPVKSGMQRNIPRYSSKNRAMFVLEMNQGWFERNGIKIGERFSFETQ